MKLQIWTHLLKKSVMKIFILCAVRCIQLHVEIKEVFVTNCKRLAEKELSYFFVVVPDILSFIFFLIRQKLATRRCSENRLFVKFR